MSFITMDPVWESYLLTFQKKGVSDQLLATAISEAVFIFDDDVLHGLITRPQSGRRVFKQLCLKGDIPFSVFVRLEAGGETDLAFHVVVSHSMWPFVLQLYDNREVGVRSRGMAFRKALRQGAWEVVTQMVTSEVAGVGQGRKAFLEAIRRDELLVARQLCDNGLQVTDHNLGFALQACLTLRRWESGVDFIRNFSSIGFASHRDLMTRLVEGSIEDGKLYCFLQLASERSVVRDKRFLGMMFRKALEVGKVNFVLKFCHCSGDLINTAGVLRLSITIAIQTNQWRMLRKLSKLNNFHLSEHQFHMCIRKTLKRNKTRILCAPILENCLAASEHLDLEYFLEIIDITAAVFANTNLMSLAAEWSFAKAFCNLALMLSLSAREWSLTDRIVAEFGGTMNADILVQGVYTAIEQKVLDTAVAVLKHMSPVRAIVGFRFVLQSDPNTLEALIQNCNDNGMRSWSLHIAAWSRQWDLVSEQITTLHDRSILDFIIAEAAHRQRWDLVLSLLNRCSPTPAALAEPLIHAVRHGEPEIAQLLMHIIDPRSAEHLQRSLLQMAVGSSADREGMLRLCIKAGLSTHEARHSGDGLPSVLGVDFESTFNAMQQALHNGQMPLVRLLHASGTSSNAELTRLNCDPFLRRQLQGQGREDIVEYLEEAASSPRSLTDLCRLQVSHLIGCQPGREHRVCCLPVPGLVKAYIQFSDLLHYY